MRKLMILLFCLFLAGCPAKEKSKPVIRIDNIKVSLEEFQKAYKASALSATSAESKKEFLDVFISRKLMLKEAEEMNLDKDPDFLTDIQLFWEQSLLKRVLSKKTQDAAFQPRVTEQEIQDFYAKHQEKEFAGRELAQVSGQIRIMLFREKQQTSLRDWVAKLKGQASISIDYQALGISP